MWQLYSKQGWIFLQSYNDSDRDSTIQYSLNLKTMSHFFGPTYSYFWFTCWGMSTRMCAASCVSVCKVVMTTRWVGYSFSSSRHKLRTCSRGIPITYRTLLHSDEHSTKMGKQNTVQYLSFIIFTFYSWANMITLRHTQNDDYSSFPTNFMALLSL